MLCHRCGSQVPDEVQSCQNCGQEFTAEDATRQLRTTNLVLRRRRKTQVISGLPFGEGDLIDNRYQVQEVLGTGALGGVYRVEDTVQEQELALKIIFNEYLPSDDAVKDLRQMMRRVKRLSHNNIVRIYDEGNADGTFYFTMQYLEGLTLSKIIGLRREKEQVFNLQEVEPILSQIADALEYAHSTLYHGYLKPQNIIVLPDMLKLTDFGLVFAMRFDKLLQAQKKQPEALVYLAPEMTRGRDCDGRADIYSLGIILGEMLTCRSNPEDIPSIYELNPEVNELIDVVYRRAIADDQRDRYQHVADMMADITSILNYGELCEDDEIPTIIVSEDHSFPLGGIGEDEFELAFSDIPLRSEQPPPLPHQAISTEQPPPLPHQAISIEQPPPLPHQAISTEQPLVSDYLRGENDEGDEQLLSGERQKLVSAQKTTAKEHEEDEEAGEMILSFADMADDEEDYAEDSEDSLPDSDHKTIPAEAQTSGSADYMIRDVELLQKPSLLVESLQGRPMIQFTGEIETFRLSGIDAIEHNAGPNNTGNMTPLSLPSVGHTGAAVGKASIEVTRGRGVPLRTHHTEPQDTSEPHYNVAAEVSQLEYGQREHLSPFSKGYQNSPQDVAYDFQSPDDGDTAPASPVPHIPDPPLLDIHSSYPDNAPTIPARVAPQRTVPIEQTYRLAEEALSHQYAGNAAHSGVDMALHQSYSDVNAALHPQVPLHAQAAISPHIHVPAPSHDTHIDAEIDEEDTGFSHFGIFFFVLGMMLIVGAGSAALYVKFFYFPSRQTALIENLPKTLEKLSAGVELPDGGTDAIADVTPERKALAMIPSQPDHLGTQAFPTPDAGDVSKLPKTVPPDAGTADIPEEKPQPPPKVKVAKVEPPKLKEPVIKVKQPIQPKPIARKKVPQKRPIERKVKVATLTPVEPKPKPSRAPTSNRCPRDMAYIAAGSFQMGSAEDDNMRGFGELTLAWRKTEAYCIDRYEYPGRGKMPRVGVNFYQAQKICEEQNKRLCTEIEWERACKGGQNYRYPYGNNFSAYACNTQAGGGQSRSLVPTSSFSKCRNRYGIYDMSGNAAEWTLSHFRPNGPTRTIRGGAANRPDWDVRCASRAALAPSSGRNLLGFRCCAEPK